MAEPARGTDCERGCHGSRRTKNREPTKMKKVTVISFVLLVVAGLGTAASADQVPKKPCGQFCPTGAEASTVQFQQLYGNFVGRIAEEIIALAFHPSQPLLLSGDAGGTLRLWRVPELQEVEIFEGHTSLVRSVAFSPSGDLFASGSNDMTIRLWRLGKKEPLHVLNGHRGDVVAIVFSLDGRKIISGSKDKTVRIWNVETGVQERVLEGHTAGISAVALLPDGKHLISGGYDRTLRTWNLESGTQDATFTEQRKIPLALVVDGPNNALIVAGADTLPMRLRLDDGHFLQQFEGHQGWVYAAQLLHGGTRIVTAGADASIRLWGVGDVAPLATISDLGKGVNALVASADRSYLAAAVGNRLRLFSSSSFREIPVSYSGHRLSVSQARFAENGKKVVSVANDGQVMIWDKASGAVLGREELVRKDPMLTAAITPELHLVTTFDGEGNATFWDFARQKPIGTLSLSIREASRLLVSRAGGELIVGDKRGGLLSVDTNSGGIVTKGSNYSLAGGPIGAVTALHFAADEQTFVAGGGDGVVRLFRTRTISPLKMCRGHDSAVTAVTILADGQAALSAGAEKGVRLCQFESGASNLVFQGHQNAVVALVYVPERKQAISAGLDRTIRFWLPGNGKEVAKIDLSKNSDWPTTLDYLNGELLVGTARGVMLRYTLTMPNPANPKLVAKKRK